MIWGSSAPWAWVNASPRSLLGDAAGGFLLHPRCLPFRSLAPLFPSRPLIPAGPSCVIPLGSESRRRLAARVPPAWCLCCVPPDPPEDKTPGGSGLRPQKRRASVQEAAWKEYVVIRGAAWQPSLLSGGEGRDRSPCSQLFWGIEGEKKKKPYEVLHVEAVRTSPGLLSVRQLLPALTDVRHPSSSRKPFKQLRFNPNISVRDGKPSCEGVLSTPGACPGRQNPALGASSFCRLRPRRGAALPWLTSAPAVVFGGVSSLPTKPVAGDGIFLPEAWSRFKMTGSGAGC